MALRTSSLLATFLLVYVTCAEAQYVRRPYRTLFGPSERDEAHANQLDVAATIYAGHDDTSRLSSSTVIDETLQAGRAHQGGNISLAFVRRRPRLSLTGAVASSVRYYHSLNQIGTQKHGGAMGAEWRASERLTVRLAQDIAYSPAYQLSVVMPGDAETELAFAPASPDYDLYRSKQVSYGSFAGARYVWSASREATFGYSLNYTDYFSQTNFGLQQASAKFTQRLTSGMALRLGYGLGTGTATGLRTGLHHDLDIGLSFDRSLTISPRTTIGFSSGSAIVSTDRGRQAELVGSAQLRRRLSPRWTATLAYQRGITALDGASRPLVANTFSGDVSGVLGSRTSISLRPFFTWGADVADATRSFHSTTSVARAQTVITRNWAAYAEYVHYNHRFAAAVDLPFVVAGDMRRQGLRLGVALWAPINR